MAICFTSELIGRGPSQWDGPADHPLSRDRSYFSVAACTDEAHVSRPLNLTYRQLSILDPHNDGRVIATDAIIPGSYCSVT